MQNCRRKRIHKPISLKVNNRFKLHHIFDYSQLYLHELLKNLHINAEHIACIHVIPPLHNSNLCSTIVHSSEQCITPQQPKCTLPTPTVNIPHVCCLAHTAYS